MISEFRHGGDDDGDGNDDSDNDEEDDDKDDKDDDDDDLVTGRRSSVSPGIVENRRMRDPTNIQEAPQRTPT